MGMIDDFIDRKHGRKQVAYDFPEMKEILEETYGVIVYQEQVMQISNRLAGYSLGEADMLRRAMGKKKVEEMAKQRERFVEGAKANGLPQQEGRKDFRPDGAVRRLRLQQVALGRLRVSRLRHRVPEGALPARVHVRAADLGNRQHRQGGEVHQRMPRNGHSGAAARRQFERSRFHARTADGHPLRPGRDQERRRERGGIDHRSARRAAARSPRSTISASAWILARSTAA